MAKGMTPIFAVATSRTLPRSCYKDILGEIHTIKKLSDSDLILSFKKSGDQSLIGELFQRYTHLVFGVCRKYLNREEDARDASIEIFEELPKKLKVHEVSNFKSWLYSVAKNYCLMQLRKGKNHVDLKEDMSGFVESRQDVHQIEEIEKEEQLKQLEETVKELNEEQRICIELFYLRELSYQDIMKQTGFTFKEVKSFIQNGKRNLKIALTQRHERKTS